MKKRKLLTDIFIVILMISIVLVLLSYLNVFPGEDYTVEGSLARKIIMIAIPLALVSVLLIDIVFPILSNLNKFSEKVFLIKVVVKSLLFIAAVVILICHVNGAFMNEFLGVGLFVVVYLVQFFIDLDKKEKAPVEENDEDSLDDTSDFIEDDDDDYCAYDDDEDDEVIEVPQEEEEQF